MAMKGTNAGTRQCELMMARMLRGELGMRVHMWRRRLREHEKHAILQMMEARHQMEALSHEQSEQEQRLKHTVAEVKRTNEEVRSHGMDHTCHLQGEAANRRSHKLVHQYPRSTASPPDGMIWSCSYKWRSRRYGCNFDL